MNATLRNCICNILEQCNQNILQICVYGCLKMEKTFYNNDVDDAKSSRRKLSRTYQNTPDIVLQTQTPLMLSNQSRNTADEAVGPKLEKSLTEENEVTVNNDSTKNSPFEDDADVELEWNCFRLWGTNWRQFTSVLPGNSPVSIHSQRNSLAI